MAGAAIRTRGGASSAGRWLGVQLGVSVLAAAVVAGAFTIGRAPAPPVDPMVSDAGKSLRRVPDGEIETRVLRFDPQQQAARASIASFTPTAAPALPAPVIARTQPSKQTAAVLPPPRPTTLGALPAPVVAASPAIDVAGNWKVAGVEIPGSSRVRRYVPSGSDLLKPADAAWTVSKNAAVKTVASVGSFFGL